MCTSNQTLRGRVAVVTGASSGIGEACALLLAERGAAVALLARRRDRLDKLVDEIRQTGGKALALALDIEDADAVKAAAVTVKATLGSASLLLNNAGVMYPSPIEELRQNDWNKMIGVNITGLMNATHAFIPQLVECGTENVADLINISSLGGENIFPTFAVYCGTKAYVNHLSKNLRAELGPKGVRVSILAPGFVETELQHHVTDSTVKNWINEAKNTFEWLDSKDIADIVAYTAALPRHVSLPQITVLPTKQPA